MLVRSTLLGHAHVADLNVQTRDVIDRLLKPPPYLLLVVLVNDEVICARWEHLQRFQELDQGVLLGRGQTLKRLPLLERLPCMSQHCLSHRRQQAMMKVRRLARDTP